MLTSAILLKRLRDGWASLERRKVGSTALISLLSKVLAAIMQAMTVPIAVASIGQGSFGAFLILSSVSIWITSTSVGISNALTTEMASGRAEHASPVPMVGAILGALQALVVSLVCYVVIVMFLPKMLGTADPALLQEARIAGILLVVASGFQLAIQPLQGMQLGVLQGSVMFAFQAVANLTVIIGLLCLRWVHHPTLLTFCMVISISPLLVGLLNVSLFAISEKARFKWPSASEFVETSKHLYKSGLAFLIVNLATYSVMFGPTVFLAWMTRGQKFLAFSIYNRVIFFLIYFVWLLALPLWPALVHARAKGEEVWIRRALHMCFLLFASVAVIIFIVAALFSRQLITLWVGSDIGQTVLFGVVFAAYYVLVVWREFLITVLISFERVSQVAKVQLAQTAVAYLLAFLLIPRLGEMGMAIAMAAGIAVTSAWIMPLLRVRSPSGQEHSVANLFLTKDAPRPEKPV